MKRISLFLSVQQYDALKRLSERLGLSVSELIRRAIDAFLRQEKS